MTAHEPARRSRSVAGAAGGRRDRRGRDRPDEHRSCAGAALYPRAAGAAGDRSGCSTCSPSPRNHRFADPAADDPVTSRIADHAYDGLAVTDPRGHVVYSDAAYLALTGAATALEARGAGLHRRSPTCRRRCFACSRRRAKASASREVPASPAPKVPMAVRCGCGTAARPGRARGEYAVSSISDVTATANARRNVFQELQHAIEYRSCAVRVLLGQCRRRPRLRQRHPGELARSRSRGDRLGRPEADRHRVRRRRFA